MHPILVKLGPVTVHSYGFMMALGVALALWFLYRQSKNQGLDAPRLLDAAFYILIISLLGAKLILLLGNAGYYLKNPRELLSIARSGGVFQGGLAFGIAFALWYFRKHKLPTWRVGDIAAPALALGHGFGRLGCFLAGCCYGRECDLPWAISFHDEYAHNLTGLPLSQGLHPVQIYEAVLNFTNFLVLYLVLRRKKFTGQVFALYIINYSVIRYFTEFFRGDHLARAYVFEGPSAFLSVSYPQMFCLVGLAAGALVYRVFKKRRRD
ncbi:MAG: prolipoprotein diacylglyceryl transferase [Candidatus Aminicenantes bacterium]|nr:prolipoprotein diacylglyceryl transferase [Candidatus Aminicenantes bacterium]